MRAPNAPLRRLGLRLRIFACWRFSAAYGRLGVEPERGLEEIFGRRRLEQLVEEDAGVVQERRLARLGLERVEQGRGGGDERADPAV